ncbi:response regulator transcription factor [Achromobacter insuavis]|uniref:response regulator transcription factor n=1 Tax=Achromobacter insuavis TaxID=1287735 RepID=UPI003B9A6378
MPGADGLLCIGLLEDDADFREELALGLGGYGFRVAFACDNAAAFYRRLQEQPCDIVILDAHLPGEDADAHLPGEDGFSVATRLRALSPVGIVMLTGRSALEDRVRGLEGGADVYMTKPVDLLELSSVIRSLARRMRLAKSPRPADAETRAAAADTSWSLQDGGWILVAPDGASLHLSAQERTFLMALMDAAGSAVSRQALAELFLPDSPGGFELRRIDVLVSRLRAKAQSAGLKLPVLSVRGQGYVFAA